jgi:pyrimidine-nucleoside phosphorylase
VIPTEVIERKRDGGTLSADDLRAFLQAYLDERVPDYQVSALLMAVYFQGLDRAETDALVRAMLESGASLDLSRVPGPCVDKHSTGGVGDKVSLALAPLVASSGVYVPMMSGRGLGHTTGTLDKLEAIPGFRTDLGLDEFVDVVARVGCAMIGQTSEIAPLDRRLYALRDVTGTVPAIPLIAASIMSKKLAEDLDGLVLDVKVGDGAFLPDEEDALALARLMVAIGTERGLTTRALVTAMDRPLGIAVGNGLETAEAIACLRGDGPEDLRELVLALAAEMVLLADPGSDGEAAAARVRAALDGGDALEVFARLVEAQGGDPAVVDDPLRLATAPHREEVRSETDGTVVRVMTRRLGEGVVRLGGGRQRVDQAIDPGVGFEVSVRPGAEISAGDLIGVVHARDAEDGRAGARLLRESVAIGERGSEAPLRPLISHRIGGDALDPV